RKDLTEPISLRLLFQPGARIGDSDESTAGFLLTDGLLHPLEEVLLEDVRLERRAGLAGDDEQRACEVDLPLEGADLPRIGRVQDVQLRVAVDLPERHR